MDFDKTVLIGSASPYTKYYGNPCEILTPLRAALYYHSGARKKIKECILVLNDQTGQGKFVN